MEMSRAEGRRRRALKGIPPLMMHEQRQALIMRAFPVVRVHPKLTHGGTFIRDSVPTEGRRLWKETPEDEEWCRNKWEEK